MVHHRRGPWSQAEDAWLISLVHRNGAHNWVRISQEISSRSPKQCRERYHQNLKSSLNHDPITEEEGATIEQMVKEMGKKWAEIARRIPGRSDNAVKNWWNGRQNRRMRNPERHSHRALDSSYPYQTPAGHYDDRTSHSSNYSLPPPARDIQDSYYSSSRRSSLTLASPHALRLPHPLSHESSSGARPHPIEIHPHGLYSRGRNYETPMPSPSGYSVVSADGAPSLITDNGSESRSPRGAASPMDLTRAPLVRTREERRNSSTRYLPQSGFPEDDVEHSLSYDLYKRRSSLQLPLPHRSDIGGLAFREPDYRERPQLLTQPAPQHLHHSVHLPTPALSEQRQLPSFSTLAEPGRVPVPQPSSETTSPACRQLPSPFPRPTQSGESKSAPTSPRDSKKDGRMDLSRLL